MTPEAGNRSIEYANICMEKRGYVVMRWIEGPNPPPQIGSIIEHAILGRPKYDEYVPGPFYVLSETDWADHQQQAELLGSRSEMPDLFERFFRVVAE